MGRLVNRGFNLLLCSAAPLSTLRYMVFGDRFDDRVQEVAWPDSVVRLEIDGVQGPAWRAGTLAVFSDHAVGGGTWPSTLNWMMVSDDFEPSTAGITS